MTLISERDKIRKLALVRCDGLGDFLLWLPTARFYRKSFPNAKIVFILTTESASIAGRLPYCDEIVAIDRNSLTSLIHFRSRGFFDAAINLQFSRTRFLDELMEKISATIKIAVDFQGANMTEEDFRAGNKIYSGLVKVTHKMTHEIDRNFEILNSVTGLKHPITLESIRDLAGALPKEIKLPPHYVAIFPGASWTKRSYPWPRIVEVCEFIHEKFGLKSVLCGSANDQNMCSNIFRNARGKIIDLCGSLSIPQSIGIISNSKLVIANDSFAAHAANLSNTRSICFLGGGYNKKKFGERTIGRFIPYSEKLISKKTQICLEHPLPCMGCSNICMHNDRVRDCLPCIDYISLDRVKEAVFTMLSSAEAPSVSAGI